MAIPNIEHIRTYDEFQSPFVTPRQRQEFLIACAREGFKSVCKTWPTHAIRMFIFGSASKPLARVGANSDLDIAFSGVDDIAEKSARRCALLSRAFRNGLPVENRMLPLDVLTFNSDNPQTWFAKEIVEHGIEIKLVEDKTQ